MARAQLEWRISIKVFTDANGNLPTGRGFTNVNSLAAISNRVDFANQVLDATGRGYRWRLLEIVMVAGTTGPLPSTTNSWFEVGVGSASQDELDAAVHAQTAAFQYRNNAINFYVTGSTNGPNGGYCSMPTEGQDTILVAQNSFSDVLIHEAGHFFSLNHTHDSQGYQNNDGTACTNSPPCSTCAKALGGDDGVADTPLDNVCWTRDNIAQTAYAQNYTNLNSAQQFFVDNSWLNIMSYHSPGVRFTDDQLDFITDVSNTSRFNVATGRTRFVDRTHPGDEDGSRANPFQTVVLGFNTADPGDIVLIRPGNYNEPGSYTKAVTFRATRGTVTIGIP